MSAQVVLVIPVIILLLMLAIQAGLYFHTSSIAGAAAATREPVELCNLQQDLGGVARPDARQTKVSGSLAVPIFSTDGSAVLGVLGIGMQDPHDFSDEEIQRLAHFAKILCEDFSA